MFLRDRGFQFIVHFAEEMGSDDGLITHWRAAVLSRRVFELHDRRSRRLGTAALQLIFLKGTMMPVLRDFLPSREIDLFNWLRNFNQVLILDPESYGVSILQADQFNDLYEAFGDSFKLATTPETRSSMKVADKNQKMKPVVAMARLLSRIIQANPSVTNVQKIGLGLTVREKSVRKIDAPAEAPDLFVESVWGYTITILLLKSTEKSRRGRPIGSAGASVWTFIGDEPSSNRHDWASHGNFTKTMIDLQMPISTASGAKVWVSAAWYSVRGEYSPMSAPRSIHLPGGMVVVKQRVAA